MLLAELQSEGFDVAPYSSVKRWEDASSFAERHGFPVVMKLASGEHKTEVGGVMLNIYDEELLRSAYEYFKKKFRRKPLLVQKQIVDGLELYAGLKADETFGRVLLFGTGGIYVEVFKDITSRVCPINEEDVEEMIDELKGGEIIRGYRGKKFNIDALKKALVKLCRFGERRRVKELDLNPLMLTEERAIIVDARMRL